MFDQFTPKGRVLAGALDCAGRKSWADVTLADIAEAAKLPLAELRNEFGSKREILAALVRAVDDEVLKRAPRRAEGQAARDLLFDIIMSRFDVLGPQERAQVIHASGPADLTLARPLLFAMHWMLEAAGIATDGVTGGLRITGLATLYASVFRVWLETTTPAMPAPWRRWTAGCGAPSARCAMSRTPAPSSIAWSPTHPAWCAASCAGLSGRTPARAAKPAACSPSAMRRAR